MSKQEEIIYYDEIIKNIEEIFTSKYYDKSIIYGGEDKMIETEKVIITLTSTQNMNKNKNNNMTLIYFEECENKLRKYYNLSDNETLMYEK